MTKGIYVVVFLISLLQPAIAELVRFQFNAFDLFLKQKRALLSVLSAVNSGAMDKLKLTG